jgi:16S rRNA (adenine1518-N6/adenine1519-N6)-dimethyltransferase
VASAVVHLVPADQPEGVDPKVLEQLTAAAFGQRRKMLRQSLKSVEGGLKALEAAGIAADRRAETVSVGEWLQIARSLTAARSGA